MQSSQKEKSQFINMKQRAVMAVKSWHCIIFPYSYFYEAGRRLVDMRIIDKFSYANVCVCVTCDMYSLNDLKNRYSRSFYTRPIDSSCKLEARI